MEHLIQTILVLLILAGVARVVLFHLPSSLGALAAKLEAEAEHNFIAADERLNASLIASVHGALLYARTHTAEIEGFYEHEKEYVLDQIEQDIRFAHVSEERIVHAIEQVIHGTPLPPALPAEMSEGPATVPQDGTSAGPGK